MERARIMDMDAFYSTFLFCIFTRTPDRGRLLAASIHKEQFVWPLNNNQIRYDDPNLMPNKRRRVNFLVVIF